MCALMNSQNNGSAGDDDDDISFRCGFISHFAVDSVVCARASLSHLT